MLRLDPFRLVQPTTLEEALSLLASDEQSMPIAGGTDLVAKLKRAQFQPELVVSLERIPELRGVRREGDAITLGAQTTLRELERAPELSDFPALRSAIASVATPILRNRATLAGNLLQDTRCHYVDRSRSWREGVNHCLKLGTDGCRVAPGADRCYAALCSDVAPALAVLGAQLLIVGANASRTMPLEDLYRDDGIHNLTLDGELLREVRIPIREERSVYKKLRMRGSFDFPELGLALRAVEVDGVIELAVAVSAVAPHLVVARTRLESRQALQGWMDGVAAGVKPMDTGFFPPDYRKQVLKSFLRQAVHELLPDR